MHRWGNFVVPITSFPGGPHWGFSSSGGYLDCLDISNIIDHGAGKFSAPNLFYTHFSEQYSPIELYLAGFIPPEEVPDFQTAEDGEYLLDERGYIVEDDNGYRMFTASGFKTYTIEDIIAEHGSRVPDHSQAQKDFRAAVILLVSEQYPATRERLERLSDDVSWFSHPGKDEFGPPVTNFYEATGGRGTITMGGLSRSQSRTRARRLAPSSFGTPPPPIVDLSPFCLCGCLLLRRLPAAKGKPGAEEDATLVKGTSLRRYVLVLSCRNSGGICVRCRDFAFC